jgi:hypothetical protein
VTSCGHRSLFLMFISILRVAATEWCQYVCDMGRCASITTEVN